MVRSQIRYQALLAGLIFPWNDNGLFDRAQAKERRLDLCYLDPMAPDFRLKILSPEVVEGHDSSDFELGDF